MSATFGGRSGRQGRFSEWLRARRQGRPLDPAADDTGREELLLASAAAGLPLAPAAYPSGFRCSCDRVGCPTPARHPVSFAWQTQSTTDRGQIERWARHQPEANFITATGMVHDVLDVPLAAGYPHIVQHREDCFVPFGDVIGIHKHADDLRQRVTGLKRHRLTG